MGVNLSMFKISRRPCVGEKDLELTTVTGFGIPKGFSNRSWELFYLI